MRLLELVRQTLRNKHYACRTQQCYLRWIRQYIRFHKNAEGFRHPATLGGDEVRGFLTALAVERHVSASTQNQALSALLFLYRDVLHLDLGSLAAVRARRSQRLPVVLSREEVRIVLDAIDRPETEGPYGLMARLLYGAGLRLMECCRLRVKDVDFPRMQLVVRQGQGDKERVVMLPYCVRDHLAQQIRQRQVLHKRDRARGLGRVSLPDALAVPYPAVPTALEWQFVFASRQLTREPHGDDLCRHHVYEGAVQRAVAAAVKGLPLDKRVSCHTLLHCFATHLLEWGCNIRTLQELLGHADVGTTLIYTHLSQQGVSGVRSPLDALVLPL